MVQSKEFACSAAGNMGSIPESGRSSGERHSNSLQYSCLEKPVDRGAWQAAIHSVAMTEALSMQACSSWNRYFHGPVTNLHIIFLFCVRNDHYRIVLMRKKM